MIHEIALFLVKTDRIDAFTHAFDEVAHLLSRAKGYAAHQLMQGVETASHFYLIVQWQKLEDHTQGFETSEDHGAFMLALQEYLAAEPIVHHVRTATSTKGIYSSTV